MVQLHKKFTDEQVKLSKNTVRKYLRSSEPPHFNARQYKRLLDQYEETVKLAKLF